MQQPNPQQEPKKKKSKDGLIIVCVIGGLV